MLHPHTFENYDVYRLWSVQNYIFWDLQLNESRLKNYLFIPAIIRVRLVGNPCAAYQMLFFIPLRLAGDNKFHYLTLVFIFYFDPTLGVFSTNPSGFSPGLAWVCTRVYTHLTDWAGFFYIKKQVFCQKWVF